MAEAVRVFVCKACAETLAERGQVDVRGFQPNDAACEHHLTAWGLTDPAGRAGRKSGVSEALHPLAT